MKKWAIVLFVIFLISAAMGQFHPFIFYPIAVLAILGASWLVYENEIKSKK